MRRIDVCDGPRLSPLTDPRRHGLSPAAHQRWRRRTREAEERPAEEVDSVDAHALQRRQSVGQAYSCVLPPVAQRKERHPSRKGATVAAAESPHADLELGIEVGGVGGVVEIHVVDVGGASGEQLLVAGEIGAHGDRHANAARELRGNAPDHAGEARV